MCLDDPINCRTVYLCHILQIVLEAMGRSAFLGPGIVVPNWNRHETGCQFRDLVHRELDLTQPRDQLVSPPFARLFRQVLEQLEQVKRRMHRIGPGSWG
jgi:hypothetical protein